MPPAAADSALARARAASRHLDRLLATHPELLVVAAAALAQPFDAAAMSTWLASQPTADEAALKAALRRFKRRCFVALAVRDLAAGAALAEIVEGMTVVAEAAVSRALVFHGEALKARYGTPRNAAGDEQMLIVVGMGKLGGRELNVSSDIDLIFVYPEDGDTDAAVPSGKSVSNFDYFTRLGRALINAIADITEDGQVFRVDMRLRPNGDSGPLVCSFDMLEQYFIAQGREWERYAWIKARALTGGDVRAAGLDAIRRPFVFRKYLDFGAINAMRELHAQIRREVAKRDMAENVKLGPGGIREIEFMAQVFQLIRGGREPALQQRPTLLVLTQLAAMGVLRADAVSALAGAYDFLRRLEHRLQWLDDAQTHRLPAGDGDRLAVAQAMGFGSFDALLAELDDHRAVVAQHFNAVFGDPTAHDHPLLGVWQGAAEVADAALDAFARLGYVHPQEAAERLSSLRNGTRYQQMPAAIRERFDALVPPIIAASATTASPDATLARCLDLLEAISRRAAYLALLQQYPQALDKVVHLCGATRWGAGYLQRHPILLDEMLDARLLDAQPDWPAFRTLLDERLTDAGDDTERQMDIMRELHHAQVFRLLSQDLAGQYTVERLADHLSLLADTMLGGAIPAVWQKVATRHREVPRFAVIAYGKLGGKELGYASDLDLVFLFDDDAPDCAQIYARLATRLNTWLSAQTPAGQLFETDLRLRPNGDSGLVVTSLAAFRQYQLHDAWVWEHQALTRARFAAGDAALGAAFEAIREEVLRQPRDAATLRTDVLAMRQKMLDAHATKGDAREDSFDLKHDPGGLVDVEFIVQYLVLAHAATHGELTGNLGNIALLGIAARLGLIDTALAERVRSAYRDYRRRQHALRLNNLPSKVHPDEVAHHAAAVRMLWAQVLPSI